MQTWKCLVRTPSNYIQTLELNAYDYSDAISIAESSTGGKCINATAYWQSDNSVCNDTEDNGSGMLALGAIILLVAAWKWVFLILGISAIVYLIFHLMKD